MKKFFCICAVLLGTYQISRAQVQKGSQNLALSVGYQHASTNGSSGGFNSSSQNNKSNSLNIGPSYGFFVGDGLELGANLDYNHSFLENTTITPGAGLYTNQSKSDSYSGNIFLRKYVLYDNKIGFRVGPYAGYGFGKSTLTDITGSTATNTTNIKQIAAGATFDLVYYPTSKVGLAASIANFTYNHVKSTGAQVGSTDLVGFNFVNTGLILSVFLNLGK